MVFFGVLDKQDMTSYNILVCKMFLGTETQGQVGLHLSALCREVFLTNLI